MHNQKVTSRQITIKSDGDAGNTQVILPGGKHLGLVQSITWTIKVGELSTCTIVTVLPKTDLKVLPEHTTVYAYDPLSRKPKKKNHG